MHRRSWPYAACRVRGKGESEGEGEGEGGGEGTGEGTGLLAEERASAEHGGVVTLLYGWRTQRLWCCARARLSV